MALLIVLLLVFGGGIGIWAAVAGGSAAPEPGVTTPAVAASPSDTPSAEPTPTTAPTTAEPSIGATPPLPVSCTSAEAALAVTAPASASAGASVRADITVTVTGGSPCLVNLGSQALVVDVYSGSDLIWTTTQCPFEPTSRELLLPPGESDAASVVWGGTRSVEGCAQPGEVALPGTYRVVATATREGQVLTGEATFVLDPPAAG